MVIRKASLRKGTLFAVAFLASLGLSSTGFAQSSRNAPEFKYGFIDRNGRIAFMVPIKSPGGLGSFSEDLCKYWESTDQGGRFGFIDRSGKKVVAAQFANAGDFHNGRAYVQLPSAGTGKHGKGRFGYIDKTGRMVVEAKYFAASDFSEGLAAVKLESEGKTGFIDLDGKTVIAPQFSWAAPFSEGLAGTERGYIDHSGKVKILSNQGGRAQFSCGLACRETLSLSHAYYQVRKDGFVYADNRLFGYIDRTGRFTILPRFRKCYEFSEERALVELPFSLPPDRYTTGTHSVYGFIDKTGNVVTVLRTSAEPHKFKEGLACVNMAYEGHSGWGFIDTKGNVVITPELKQGTDFSEGLAAVPGGYIDKTGKMAIGIECLSNQAFSEGLAAVTYLPSRY